MLIVVKENMFDEIEIPTCKECGEVLEEGRIFYCLKCEQKIMSENDEM